jgi:hypothetical protein
MAVQEMSGYEEQRLAATWRKKDVTDQKKVDLTTQI